MTGKGSRHPSRGRNVEGKRGDGCHSEQIGGAWTFDSKCAHLFDGEASRIRTYICPPLLLVCTSFRANSSRPSHRISVISAAMESE